MFNDDPPNLKYSPSSTGNVTFSRNGRDQSPLRSDDPATCSTVRTGKVWVVGAGPGDADLLTVRAMRAIQQAELILFDQLISEEIKALFPQAVPAFYVGKSRGNHSIAQKDLNSLMIKKARAGYHVCRIKGGDPFIFGRGGEEMLALLRAGVEAEVVPGITSASGCATYAGIPLTHRGLSQGCTFVTAQGETKLNLNWKSLAAVNHTLVFYMGLSRAQLIQDKLIAEGLSGLTPAAVIENGCRKNQRVFTGSLRDLHSIVIRHQVCSPALIVVGNVVALAEQLQPVVQAACLPLERERLTA